MRHHAIATVLLCFAATSVQAEGLSGDRISTDNGALVVHPVSHATFVMQWNGKTIYVDPVGGVKPFADLPKPDLVLVTHMHGDHFDPATLEALVPAGGGTVIVVTKAVAEKIPDTLRSKVTVKTLANEEKTEAAGISVEAVPAYNTSPGKEKFHPKGPLLVDGSGFTVSKAGLGDVLAASDEGGSVPALECTYCGSPFGHRCLYGLLSSTLWMHGSVIESKPLAHFCETCVESRRISLVAKLAK